MVTTTVETALEEFEAVPCWRWDAGTVWMRTCSQRERLVSSLQTKARREAGVARGAPWPHLCGLALLLELLQLLGSEEAHGLVASYELGARWHGGEDDVAAQPTEAVDGKQDRALAPARIRPRTKGN